MRRGELKPVGLGQLDVLLIVNGRHKTKDFVASSVGGFVNNKYVKIKAEEFSKYDFTLEEASKKAGFFHNTVQNADYFQDVLGDEYILDKSHLRFIVSLLNEGDTMEDMIRMYKRLEDVYHELAKTEKNPRNIPCTKVCLKVPELKKRYFSLNPESIAHISEELFGEYISGYEKFIIGMNIDTIGRVYGNNNKDTFDYIRFEVKINSSMQNDSKMHLCRVYKKHIMKHALYTISKDSKFVRYGVPVNILSIDNMVLTNDSRILITFGIKKEICNNI